jgi:hypothetical protein
MIDLKEEQVIAMAMKDGELYALGTGHPGTLYTVAKNPGDKGAYLSKILDTGSPSFYGTLDWTGRGSVTIQTRTGNTAKPDETWSQWSSPIERPGTKIESPRNRFFQLRILFSGDPSAVVTHVKVFFTTANQRPVVHGITVGKQNEGDVTKLGNEKYASKLAIKIKASDPDGDALVYRLFYRSDQMSRWIPLTEDKPLLKPEATWTVSDMPDGTYQIKALASDELSNPREEALEGSKVSDPFLIDNRKPSIEDLSVDIGRNFVLRGRARDGSSRITRIEYAVDGGSWKFVYPKDRVFDSKVEEFSALLGSLSRGNHRVTVRVKDHAGNTAVSEIEFSTE